MLYRAMKPKRLTSSEGFRVGSGSALVKKKRYKLRANTLLFIARGERHEIRRRKNAKFLHLS